jgi:methyl-accepting chemotaxis protein
LADVAVQQSNATDQVSTSTVEYAAQIRQLEESAGQLRDLSHELARVVSAFTVADAGAGNGAATAVQPPSFAYAL